jgi:hypothetical protein
MQPRLQLLSSPDHMGNTLESALSQLTTQQAEIDTRRNAYSTGPVAQTLSSLRATSEQPEVDVPVDATTGSQALILSPLQNQISISDPDDIDANDIADVDQSINETLEQQFDDSTQEIWEDLRSTSRKLLRYAEDVLHASSQPQAHHSPEVQDTQDNVEGAELDSDSNHITIDSKHGRIRLPSSAARGLRYNEGPSEVNMTISDNDRQLPIQEAIVDRPVALKTPDGRSFLFPYSSVRTWDVSTTPTFLPRILVKKGSKSSTLLSEVSRHHGNRERISNHLEGDFRYKSIRFERSR